MYKFNTLNYSKSSLRRLYSSRSNIKSSKDYYDILKITPHATQNEVKSAYYKLSLQYHPDKNKSGYAKQKFHDISEAYEVLGNHELRKNYDRDIMIRQSPSSNAQESPFHNKDKVYSGSSKIYNFDEWTNVHYGKQMHMYRERRGAYERYKQMKESNRENEKPSRAFEFVLLLLTIAVIVMFAEQRVDVPVSENKKDINKK